MLVKIVKKIENKLKTKHEKIIAVINRYPAASLATGVLSVLVGCGNPFVIGAALGGFLSAKQIEDMKQQHSKAEPQTIPVVIIGAMLGGLTVVSTVLIGAHLGSIGCLLGSLTGVIVTTLFSGRMSELVAAKITCGKCTTKNSTTKKYSQ